MESKRKMFTGSLPRKQSTDKRDHSSKHQQRLSKESRKQTTTHKEGRPFSKDSSKTKQRPLSSTKNNNKKNNAESTASIAHLAKKKPVSTLARKKIEQLRPPQILIKVSYKGKRIAIPIANVDQKGLSESILPHIIRFQRQILNNEAFNPNIILNWKTIGRGDPIKDYYFQTNRPISVFRNQLLEVEPIWRQQIRPVKSQAMQLKDFEIIKCIGTGGFSRVFLGRFKPTGVFYALKLMEKEGLLQKGKQCVVSNQRNILVGIRSPHIVNLEFAFETKHFVVLGLEYCPGGELFYYLRKVRKMNEEDARYCFVEILLGIQYLHSQKIVYRDIKPENIMIDANGNLKIADFGLSKQGLRPNDLATTYCGSPQYMAPQMLAKTGHSYALDYYCLGALLYELVTGNPPFYSRDVDKIYYAIQNQQIQFPQHIDLSPQIKMLLEGLLIKQPKRRLGSMGGVRQILGHPWVRKLKTADIINKTVLTPIKIDILTFNVNEEEIEEGNSAFLDKIEDEDMNFEEEFQDFYFNRYEENNILDEALPSVKSDSTKENKSFKIPQSTAARDHNEKLKGLKSSVQRQSSEKYALEIGEKRPIPVSQIRSPKQKKKLKKQKSTKQMNLIVRAKKRDDKSIVKHGDKERSSGLKGSQTGLKRIKSSTALLEILKKQK